MRTVTIIAALSAVAVAAGCVGRKEADNLGVGGEKRSQRAIPGEDDTDAAAPVAVPKLVEKSPIAAEGDLLVHQLGEDSFIDSLANRDPFRSFLKALMKQAEVAAKPQVTSLLDQFQVDALKVVAIIQGSGPHAGSPIAMLVDPEGVGHVVRRGNFVGKGETVRRITSGEEVQIFWKVARIREDAVVFEREDPFSTGAATVTKVLYLKPPEGGA